MKAISVEVELRHGWPMHVGAVTNEQGDITWRAPVARTNPAEALADAQEYLGDTRDIDSQIEKLDALMKERRARVLDAMKAEQCSCTMCERTRALAREVMQEAAA